MTAVEKCSKQVWSGSWHTRPCKKPGKVQHEGKWYCGVHNPERRIKRDQEWRAASDARERHSAQIETEGRALLKRLGAAGYVDYGVRSIRVRRLVLSFDDAEKLAKELGR